jgi:hypothetical protein
VRSFMIFGWCLGRVNGGRKCIELRLSVGRVA